MAGSTRFTNLEVTGKAVNKGIAKSTYTATSTDPTAAASTAPTKEEFDAV